MTKEQVQQHGPVIKWFCNNPDKGVWYYSKLNSSWVFTNSPDFILDYKYVQNDEYAEFRKALADGKIIEFSGTEDGKNWAKASEYTFTREPKHYRIKPDEPSFKVGNWAKLPDEDYQRVYEVSDLTVCLSNFGSIGIYTDTYTKLKLWVPELEEYVWYGYELVQVINNSNPIEICRRNSDSCEKVTLDKLEPFVSRLPSFIKD